MTPTEARRTALLRQRKVLETQLETFSINQMKKIEAINAKIAALPAE